MGTVESIASSSTTINLRSKTKRFSRLIDKSLNFRCLVEKDFILIGSSYTSTDSSWSSRGLWRHPSWVQNSRHFEKKSRILLAIWLRKYLSAAYWDRLAFCRSQSAVHMEVQGDSSDCCFGSIPFPARVIINDNIQQHLTWTKAFPILPNLLQQKK